MLNEFFLRMKNILNDDYEAFVEALEKPAFQSIHINTNKDTTNEIAAKYNLKPHPYVSNGYYFNKEEIQLGKLPYHEAGLYYIQEPSAMLVSELADIKQGMRVLDMCAAPGGKSTKAGILVGEDGLLICNDISNSRAKILSENIERFGLKNTLVSNIDPVLYANYLPNFFDVVIVDAPCSGEGMFRKLDQAKTTWSPEKVQECASIQANLIKAAYDCLKPGGLLVYSTCTYAKEENEMAQDFKDEKKDKKNIFIKILDILLWIILIGWMAIVFMDYYRVTNEKEPKFCIKEETIQYEDGTVESCTGLGYKVYEYNRDSFDAIEFGPFWAKDRSDKESDK